MAGLGNRFIDLGYNTPKSLLQVDGNAVIERVVEVFPGETDFIFICNEEHIKNTDMEQVLRRLKPGSLIKVIPCHKKGPVFSVAQIFDEIDDSEPVIVSYCDYDQAWDYEQFKKDIVVSNCAGAIPAFTGFHPTFIHNNRYAGVLTDENGRMLDLKEKHYFTDDPANSFHSTGVHYFRSGALVKKYFQEMIDRDLNFNGEYYVSLVYNLLIRDGLEVIVPKVDFFVNLGTPAELEEFEAWSRFIHDEHKRDKAPTAIPTSREELVKISYEAASPEFKKSHDYWKSYFQKKWSI
jgi:NDP-sugar pyrophosphorylase family protein